MHHQPWQKRHSSPKHNKDYEDKIYMWPSVNAFTVDDKGDFGVWIWEVNWKWKMPKF